MKISVRNHLRSTTQETAACAKEEGASLAGENYSTSFLQEETLGREEHLFGMEIAARIGRPIRKGRLPYIGGENTKTNCHRKGG